MNLNNFSEFGVNKVKDPNGDVRLLSRQPLHHVFPILGMMPAGFYP